MTYALTARSMTVGYNGKPLIRDISFTLEKGQILTLIGPNGAGKSTILKSLTRQLSLLGGTVMLAGKSLTTLHQQDLARTMAVMLTERIRPELMTCYDVVAMGRYPYTGRLGVLKTEDHAIIRSSLERVRAVDLAQRDFLRISDGQRQRVLLARALCQEPDILVLDEPTSFLDIRHKIELLDILMELSRQKGMTVVMSLHEIDLAAKISDLVMCVHGDTADTPAPPEQVFTPEHITVLYGLEHGSYNVRFGSVELERPQGVPETFVVCGGGYGIPVFRRLQRQGVPFYAGVLFDNDVDYALAQSLAAQTFVQPAFTPENARVTAAALVVLNRCREVIDTGVPLLPGNQACGKVLARAKEMGLPIRRMNP